MAVDPIHAPIPVNPPGAPPPPGPVRRRAITPHTLASVWPLEAGEAVELANESGGPATVHVHAGCLASAGAVPARWQAEADRLRAERDAILRMVALSVGHPLVWEVYGDGRSAEMPDDDEDDDGPEPTYMAIDAEGKEHHAPTPEAAVRKAAGLDADAAKEGR